MAFIRKVITIITSWSHSRLSDYDKCPKLAFFKHVEKRKEPANTAMLNGTFVHALAQAYVSKETPEGREMMSFQPAQQKAIIAATKKLPTQLVKFKDKLAKLRAIAPQVEQMWVFTNKWVRTTWNDWDGAWLRIKMDVHYVQVEDKIGKVLYIIDYKTGKDKSLSDENDEQLRLYALGGMLMYPEVKMIVTSLWYIDYGTERTRKFVVKKDSLAKEKKWWLERTNPMLTDKTFNPLPVLDAGKLTERKNPACGWCYFRKANGGPCKF